MNTPNKSVISLLTLLWLLCNVTTISAEGNPPWQFDFNDPSSLDEWQASHGNLTVENSYIQGTECVILGDSCAISMWKNASETTGVWQFDYYNNSTAIVYGLYFYFIGNGIVESTDIDNGLHPRFAYGFHIGSNGGMSLFYQPDANTEWPVWFDASPGPNNPDGWSTYQITRNSTGYIQVSQNDVPKLEAHDNNLTTSEYVNFIFEMDSKIDNFSYYDPHYVNETPPVVFDDCDSPNGTDMLASTCPGYTPPSDNIDTTTSNTGSLSFVIDIIVVLWLLPLVKSKK